MFRCSHDHKKHPRAPLSLERLEDRWAPAAGGLDPFFGTGGKVTTPIGSVEDSARSVVIDTSDRLVVAGYVRNSIFGNLDFALARYNSAGTLDTSFGSGGKVITPIGSGDDLGFSLDIDRFGRIVVAGHADIGGTNDFAVVRYTPEGLLDSTFGVGGIVTTPISPGGDFGQCVAIDGSDRIVVAGYSNFGGRLDFALARFNDDGTLDSTFGSGGKAITENVGKISSMAIDDLGRIVVSGASPFIVARYNANGILDTSFGSAGKVITIIADGDNGAGMAIDASGRILVAGKSMISPKFHFGLARYEPNGSLDLSFGEGGKVITSVGLYDDVARSVAIDAAGRIVVGGYSDTRGGLDDFALVRYTTNGTLDTSFGGDGKVIAPIGESYDFGYSLAVDRSGRIVVAGDSFSGVPGNPGNSDFAVARFFGDPFGVETGAPSLTYTEDDGARVIDSAAAVTNSPNANLVGATVRIGNYVRNQDALNYTLQGGISGSFDPIAGALTLSNSATIADYEAVLRSLTYTNTSQQPDEHSRTITITVDDGEEADNLASATYTVHIVSVNDAPAFSDDAVLHAILQGTDEPPGRKVSSLFGGLLIDPDGDNLGGVAVVGNTADAVTQGTWQYSTDAGVSWFDVGTVGDGPTALALFEATRLRFKAVATFSGEPTPLAVRAIDSTFAGPYTAGAVRQFIDSTTNGGTTPIAATTNSVVTTVFPVAPVDNTPPTLLGVPFSANLNEGQTLSFTASATDPNAGQALSFSLAGAPAGASIDPDSGFFTWTPTEAQGPNIFVFAVRVTDGFAVTQQTVTAIIGEVNSAPDLAGVPAAATLVKGQSLSFTATATDADLVAGMPNTLTYSLIGAPAGAVIDPNTGVFTWTPSDHLPPGSYSFSVQVTDDGVPSRSDTQAVSVSLVAAGLVAGDLVITGTQGNDVIAVVGNSGQIAVVINGAFQGQFPVAAITRKIVIHGLAGNDRITIAPKIAQPAKLFGGPGNDMLTGGAGHDVLIGGDGADILKGRGGRDLLIGGLGADKLDGGPGEDILVGGMTQYDAIDAALASILDQWTGNLPYNRRRISLLSVGGLNGAKVFNPTVAPDDRSADELTGGLDRDWFWAIVPSDKLSDRKSVERIR